MEMKKVLAISAVLYILYAIVTGVVYSWLMQ